MRIGTFLGSAILFFAACLDPLTDARNATGYGFCCVGGIASTCPCPATGGCVFGVVPCAANGCVEQGASCGALGTDAAFSPDAGAVFDAGNPGADAAFSPDAGAARDGGNTVVDGGNPAPDAAVAPDAAPAPDSGGGLQYGFCCVDAQVGTCLCADGVCDPFTPCANGTCASGSNATCP